MQSNKRNWKIYYTDYSGVVRRAVEFVSAQMGELILRDAGIYSIHVTAVEKLNEISHENAVILGTYDSHPFFEQFISKDEIKKDGFTVKVIDNPSKKEHQLVLLCGDTPTSVFYAAVHFIDDYLNMAVPNRNGLCFRYETFLNRLPSYSFSSAPKAKTRSLFTWGHPINNYRKCIETLARLKFNQIIIWNDFLPVNADEIYEYAHSFGMTVIWGFAWGWFPDCTKVDLSQLDKLKEDVINTYESVYKGKGDGIYFQSFTELNETTLQGKLIAEVVTDFVNDTAGKLLKKEPDLLIQFGLHANSVKEHSEHFKKLDPRVQIIWENCGIFPYSHDFRSTEELKQDAIDFTRLVITQRPNVPVGMVFKGMLKQDWPYFEHQPGPYVMGNSTETLTKADMELFMPIWRYLQSEWMTKGDFARTLANEVLSSATGDINFNIASHIADTPWYPLALCGELFWDPTPSYESIVDRVTKRQYVNFT